MRLIAIILDNTNIDRDMKHFHHHKTVYWTVLFKDLEQ